MRLMVLLSFADAGIFPAMFNDAPIFHFGFVDAAD